jgi:predicted site-specific integrase-resolvase
VKFYSVKVLADEFGVERHTIYRWATRLELRVVRMTSKSVFFPASSVERLRELCSPKLWSYDDLAGVAGVHKKTAVRWVRAAKIKTIRISRKRPRLAESDVKQILALKKIPFKSK